MTWLAWRRSRLQLIISTLVLVALGVWMALINHWMDSYAAASFGAYQRCHHNVSCERAINDLQIVPFEFGTFSLTRQVNAINALLLMVPCLFGAVLGAPLVAREFTAHTNRLVWTQTTSRTRWLLMSWLVPGAWLAGIVGLLSWFDWHWYSTVQFETSFFGTFTRIGMVTPSNFAASGLTPVAYTAFAFTLGVALSALVRRTSWAVLGTIIGYFAVAAIMVYGVRPSLAPHGFVQAPNGIESVAAGHPVSEYPWSLGTGYRYVPGVSIHAAGSATQAGLRCLAKAPDAAGAELNLVSDYVTCLVAHHVQVGTFYMSARSYWALQWRESAIYVALTGGLVLIAVWSVRRWRA